MISKLIEVSNGFNWGKFMVMRLDEAEWKIESQIDPGRPLLRTIGYDPQNVWVLDLQTREAACFIPGGLASADLNKHKIWVCPMFEPFLTWLYKQDCHDIRALPILVEFTQAETVDHTAWGGYRRPGPKGKNATR